MRKPFSFFIIAIALSLVACKSADNKVPEIAADVCNCFSDIEKNFSKETKALLAKAANDSNPQKVLKEEIVKLDQEDQMAIGQELMSLGELGDEKSDMGRCMKGVEKKYGNNFTRDKKILGNKIVQELESKNGCGFTASIMKLGLKMENKK
ncbi:MAG: hypothetical protein WDO71_04275 [Bacteroidota bacterium]